MEVFYRLLVTADVSKSHPLLLLLPLTPLTPFTHRIPTFTTCHLQLLRGTWNGPKILRNWGIRNEPKILGWVIYPNSCLSFLSRLTLNGKILMISGNPEPSSHLRRSLPPHPLSLSFSHSQPKLDTASNTIQRMFVIFITIVVVIVVRWFFFLFLYKFFYTTAICIKSTVKKTIDFCRLLVTRPFFQPLHHHHPFISFHKFPFFFFLSKEEEEVEEEKEEEGRKIQQSKITKTKSKKTSEK